METERAEEAQQCPQCQGVLEGYLCKACKMLYYHDLEPWVRII
jgi:hypothetical protein